MSVRYFFLYFLINRRHINCIGGDMRIIYNTPILLFLILFASCAENSSKQETSDTTAVVAEPEKAPDNVESIQKAYSSVMTQLETGKLDSVSFKYSCNEEKKGTVTYFSENGKLRMIAHQYSEYDHHSATERYFVKDSVLFFVYASRTLWAFKDGGGTKDDVTEQRTYLVDDKPIRCLEKKFVVPATAENKEVDCTSQKSVITPYQLLLKHRDQPTSGCLDK